MKNFSHTSKKGSLCERIDINIVQVLIENGAEINSQNILNKTSLYFGKYYIGDKDKILLNFRCLNVIYFEQFYI